MPRLDHPPKFTCEAFWCLQFPFAAKLFWWERKVCIVYSQFKVYRLTKTLSNSSFNQANRVKWKYECTLKGIWRFQSWNEHQSWLWQTVRCVWLRLIPAHSFFWWELGWGPPWRGVRFLGAGRLIRLYLVAPSSAPPCEYPVQWKRCDESIRSM